MSAVVEAASSIVNTAVDTVSSVGTTAVNAVQDAGQAVVDNVVKPVATAVEKTVQAAIDDPVGTAVKVAAVASGNPMLVMAANTAVAVAHGADINDALESGAKAGLTSVIAQGVANEINTPAVGSVTGPDNIDVGGGFNPATGAPALVPTTPPAPTTAGNIAKGTTAGIIQGKDPLSALIGGGVSAGTSAITSQIEGFDQLPPSAQRAINNAISTTLQGGDPSQGLVDSALSAGIAEMKAQTSSGLKAGDTGTTESVFDPTFGGTLPIEQPAPVVTPEPAPVIAPEPTPIIAPEPVTPKAVAEPISTINNGDGTVTQNMSDGSVRAIDLGTGEVIPVTPAPETPPVVASDIPSSDMGEIVITDKKEPYTGDIPLDLSGAPVESPVVTPTVTPTPTTPTTPASPLTYFANLTPAQQSTLQKLAQPETTSTGSSAITSAVPTFLTSKQVKTQFQDPLSTMYRLQNPSVANENTTNPTPLSTMSSSFYNYGNPQTIDDVLGLNMASGGLATPLMASGGLTGTRHGRYAHGGLSTNVIPHGGKMRVDFRHGDAVTGAGDGQSDDIPAMLADGEFVFPADVVAAIGNGSTKAGSDKLYDMMHGIRAHVRSAKPKDLPPEIKSPLDFLKTKRTKARS